MAKVEFKGDLPLPEEENRIKQGDFVYCKGSSGAHSFWGIYSQFMGGVISLDGAGSSYIQGEKIYLNETYNYWTIVKRISCINAKLTIEELK